MSLVASASVITVHKCYRQTNTGYDNTMQCTIVRSMVKTAKSL